ncbi:MAG: hypothetical protein LBK53_06080, partial [Heliobacteriaceae bacterium]|nr:hypothetical protein [Heliobacteriaceae bacterium]
MNKLLGLLSLVVLWGNAAIADTVDVNTFNALNTAVGEAASPRTINILDNLTSTANMNVQSAADLTINGNNFTLSGYTGYSNASGFRLINGNTLTLENINMDSFKSSNKGGAIYNDNSSSVTIGNNASFTSNTSANGGGAIYNGNSSSVTIGNNASFTSNTSTNGGGAIYGSTGSTTTLNTGSGLTTFSGNTDYRGPNDIYLYDTAKLNISGTGEVLFGSGIASSNTNAVINQNSTGNMTLESTANNANFQGTFTQTAGKTTVLGSFFNNTSANNIITNNSILDMSQAADRTINRITIDNAALSAIGGGIQAYTINNLSSGSGTANFDVDIDGLAGTSDTFAITNAGSGTLNIANFHLVNAPTAESIPLTIFSGNISGYTFTTSKTEVTTPVYNY